MSNEYRYKSSGLDNVVLVGLPECIDDDGEPCITIPHINELHKAIATSVVSRDGGMSGAELRFLRTMMGLTQAELAKAVNRDAQTIGRWERQEFENDPNAEALIRLIAIQRLALGLDKPVEEIAGWCVQTAEAKPIRIDASDPNNYRPLAA